MKKLDKKQIPQFIALCVLAAGVAGYLVMHLVAAPARVSASTLPAAAPSAAPAVDAAAKPGAAKPAEAAADPAGDTIGAPPPSSSMHDPFVVGYVDPGTAAVPAPRPAAAKMPSAPALPKQPGQMAAAGRIGVMPVSFPAAPALPAPLGGFPGRPAGLPSAPPASAFSDAPAAPLWTVTGVLQGTGGKVAILRSGDVRRIVRSGDFVDSTFRVTRVTRTTVFLRHGAASYELALGGTKATPPVKPGAARQQEAVIHQEAVINDTVIPVYHTAQPKPALTAQPLPEADPSLASEPLVAAHLPSPAASAPSSRKEAPASAADTIALGMRLLDGSVPQPSHSN